MATKAGRVMLELSGYRVVEELGGNEEISLYRVVRIEDNLSMIAKVTSDQYSGPGRMPSFQYEYKQLLELRGNGVLEPYHLETVGGRPVLFMRDSGGTTLKGMMQAQRDSLKLSNLLEVAIAIVACIRQIHREQITLNEITPLHLMVSKDLRDVKLIDIQASSVKEGLTNPLPTNEGRLESALPYLSPEQTGRTGMVSDYRSDFYSIGVILYEWFAGCLPFELQNALDLVYHHLATTPDPIDIKNKSIPRVISNIINKCMEKMPDARYASAYGIYSDLEECLIQLRVSGKVQPFPIANRDILEKWVISDGLFGRRDEEQILVEALNKASRGESVVVWVSGSAGIGKTSLVVETLGREVPSEMFFAIGKPKLSASVEPYAIWIHVIEQLVSHLLTSNQLQVEVWRLRILDALQGYGGQVLIDMVPRLQWLVGEQHIVDNDNSMLRRDEGTELHLVMDRFFGLFFENDQPLVLLLDDLQWVDEASIQYLDHLLLARDAKYVMIVGAYRDQELTPLHPLRQLVMHFRDKQVQMEEIHLTAYDHQALKQMLSPYFHVTLNGVDELIDVLLHKTGGNPLFLKEFLQKLSDHKLIFFHEHDRVWQWDIRRIAGWSVSDQMAASLSSQIIDMDNRALHILTRSAFLGKCFDIEALSIVAGFQAIECSEWAQSTVKSRLLEPVHGKRESYIFQHDRIRQSAYELATEQERSQLHLAIGWLLAGRMRAGEDVQVFEVLEHLNQVVHEVIGQGKRLELVELNLTAGLKHKQSATFETAREYLQQATELLDGACWDSCYDLSYRAYKARAEVEFLCDHLDCAHELLILLLEKAATDFDKAQVSIIMTRLEVNRDHYEEVIIFGKMSLKWLGIQYHLTPSPLNLVTHWMRVQRKLRKHSVEMIGKLAPMTDERYRLAMSVLVDISNVCFITNNDGWVSCILTMLEMTLDYGMTPEASICFAGYALMLNYQSRKYDEVYKWGKLACEVSKKEPKLYAQACNSFSLCYHSWIKYEPNLLHGFAEDISKGNWQFVDLWHANQSMLINGAMLFEFGHPLNDIYSKLMSHSSSFLRNNNRSHWKQGAIFAELISRLTGYRESDDPFIGTDVEAESFKDNLTEGAAQQLQELIYLYQYITSYLFGDYHQAYRILQQTLHTHSPRKRRIADSSSYHYYLVLVLKELYAAGNQREQQKYLNQVYRSVKSLKIMARQCPEMNLHKYLLAKAELAGLKQNDRLAEQLYEEALASARSRGYIHNVGIIAECFAKYGLRTGKSMIAKLYMNEAYEAYLKWGALAKTAEIKKKYGYLLQFKRDNDLDRIDYLSVAMSAQALSSEMEMDRLLDMLLRIMLQNAGAEYGALIFDYDGKWMVEAYGTVRKLHVESIPLHAAEHLVPTSIVGYTARINEEVVLHNAASNDAFKRNDYVKDKGLKSVLCLPIMYQSKLICLLYMENNLSTGVFTKERLDTLKLLSSQSAISIANAKLFSGIQYLKNNLETEVEERTRSLEKSMQLASEALAEATVYAERTRIAQEIHDIVGHTLTSTILQIEAGKRLLDKDRDSAVVRLKEAQDMVRHSLSEIRNSVHMLKEDKYYDIEEALHQLILETERNAGVSIHAMIDPIEHLTLMQKKVIYHALQEGLTNGIRHGHCSEFSFSIRDDGSSVQFRLADNGTGSSEMKMGFGLKMMRERVKQLKGTLNIDSEPNKGCLLRISLPYSM
ncbi:Predicted ATPase [Fontibacillus panacisegetis]|uniref:Predicted ATPase n=1 Tax=Fontibacillus panacisegetis TaxID=670482 RepID=A0A1G7L7X9_9BACL|nr:AAA family ATPase [Fontibacillus panacisegetis]SDF45140.1 Predicted ATPase [Fontibacillus panacisegetis]